MQSFSITATTCILSSRKISLFNFSDPQHDTPLLYKFSPLTYCGLSVRQLLGARRRDEKRRAAFVFLSQIQQRAHNATPSNQSFIATLLLALQISAGETETKCERQRALYIYTHEPFSRFSRVHVYGVQQIYTSMYTRMRECLAEEWLRDHSSRLDRAKSPFPNTRDDGCTRVSASTSLLSLFRGIDSPATARSSKNHRHLELRTQGMNYILHARSSPVMETTTGTTATL